VTLRSARRGVIDKDHWNVDLVHDKDDLVHGRRSRGMNKILLCMNKIDSGHEQDPSGMNKIA
jgi:hypothetical protein